MQADCGVMDVETGILGPRFAPVREPLVRESRSSRGGLSRDRWRTEDLALIDQSRILVDRLFLSPGGTKSVIFSGITAKSGCTSVVLNAAEIMAVSTSGTVCVLDANAYSPNLHNLFDLSSPRGLSDALIEDRSALNYAQRLDESNLWVLPFGTQSLIDTEKKGRCFWMRDALVKIAAQFDYVLVDAPPASQYSDTLTLGVALGGVAMIIKSGVTEREVAARTAAALTRAGARLLGVVMTGLKAV